MNNIGRSTYLSNDKDYLIVAAADIEVDHGLHLDSNYLLEKMQRITKAFKGWCGDNHVINNVTPQVFPPSCQAYK